MATEALDGNVGRKPSEVWLAEEKRKADEYNMNFSLEPVRKLAKETLARVHGAGGVSEAGGGGGGVPSSVGGFGGSGGYGTPPGGSSAPVGGADGPSRSVVDLLETLMEQQQQVPSVRRLTRRSSRA